MHLRKLMGIAQMPVVAQFGRGWGWFTRHKDVFAAGARAPVLTIAMVAVVKKGVCALSHTVNAGR